jgi:hypothetical protein
LRRYKRDTRSGGLFEVLLVIMPQEDGGGAADIEGVEGRGVRDGEVDGSEGEVLVGEALIFAA